MKWLKTYFYLFVISTLISQSLMDLFSVLFCGQWVWLVWQSRRTSEPFRLLRPMGLEWIFILWWIVCAIGFALNPMDPGYAAVRLIEFKWIFIFYVMIEIFKIIRPGPESWKFLYSFLFVVGFATCLFYFVDIPLFKDFRYGAGDFLRGGGFFGDPMTFGHSFALLLCLLLGVGISFFPEMTSKQKALTAVALITGMLAFYLSFTRGAWIGFSVGFFSLLLVWRPKLAIAAVLAFSVSFGALLRYSSDFHSRVQKTWNEAQGESERKLLWRAHFAEFQESPIFGKGYGQNTKMLPATYERLGIPSTTLVSHAHNQYLHLAAGTGILGLGCYLLVWIFFLGLLGSLYRSPLLSLWDRGVVVGLFMGQVSFLIGGLTEANFEHSKVRFLLMLAWAYVVFLAQKYQIKSRLFRRIV